MQITLKYRNRSQIFSKLSAQPPTYEHSWNDPTISSSFKSRIKFPFSFSILFYLYHRIRNILYILLHRLLLTVFCASFQRPTATINNVSLRLRFFFSLVPFPPFWKKGWTWPKSAGETRGSCLFKENHKFQGCARQQRRRECCFFRCVVRRGTTGGGGPFRGPPLIIFEESLGLVLIVSPMRLLTFDIWIFAGWRHRKLKPVNITRLTYFQPATFLSECNTLVNEIMPAPCVCDVAREIVRRKRNDDDG